MLAFLWLGIIAVAYATNAADRQIFPTLLPAIRAEFGWDLSQAGFLSTAFTLGLALIGIPAGLVVDRVARKPTIVVSMILYSAFTLATNYATGFWDMLVFRVLTGVGEGMQMAAAFAIIGSYFYDRRTFYLGWLTMAYGVGSFIGPRIAAWMHAAAVDWRNPFVWFAIAGFVLAMLVLIALPRIFTESRGPKTGAVVDEASYRHVPDTLINRNVVMGMIASAVNGLVMFGFLSLYAVYLREELKFAGADVGATLSFVGLGGFLSFYGGYIGDRIGNRWIVIGSFTTLAIVAYPIFNGVTSVGMQSFLTLIVGACASAFTYINLLSHLQRSVRPDKVGTASGMFLAAMFGAGAAAGYLMGWLIEKYGWSTATTIQLSLLPFVGVIAMLLVNPNQLLSAKRR